MTGKIVQLNQAISACSDQTSYAVALVLGWGYDNGNANPNRVDRRKDSYT